MKSGRWYIGPIAFILAGALLLPGCSRRRPPARQVESLPEFPAPRKPDGQGTRNSGYTPARAAKDLNDAGLDFQARGKLDQAIEAFRKAFSLDPYFTEARQNLAQAHVMKAADLARKRDEAASLKHYQRASNLDPLNENIYTGMADVYHARGRRLEEQGRLTEAIEAYETCLKIAPDHPGALKHAGRTALKKKAYPQALRYLEQARKVTSDDSELFELLGQLEFAQGNVGQAEMHWKRALLLNPDNEVLKERLDSSGSLRGEIYLKRAVSLAEEEAWEQANALFEKVLSLDQELQPRELLLLAETRFKTGSPAEAVDILGTVLEIRPELEAAHLLLGDIYAASGQEEMAYESYMDARGRAQDSLEAHFKLAQFSAERGRYPEAIRFLEEVLARDPRNRRALENIGIVYARCKQFDLALMYWERVKELDPDYANTYYDIALVMTRKKRYDEAIVNLRKAIELDPDNVLYHYSLSLAYRQKGMTAEARREWDNVIRLGPDTRYAGVARRMLVEEGSGASGGFSDARSLYNYAYICQQSGRLDEALTTYLEVLELDASHLQALIACGDIYLARKMNMEAAICYFRAVHHEPANEKALIGAGRAFLALGFAERAAGYLEKVYMAGRLDIERVLDLARAYEMTGRADMAVRLYSTIVERDSYGAAGTLAGTRIKQISAGNPLSGLPPAERAGKHLGLALKFVEHAFNEEAEREFKRAEELAPDNVVIAMNMGNFYLTIEQTDQAIAAFKKVLLLEPDDLAATERMAEIYWEMDRREEARPYLDIAVRLNPRNSLLLFRLVELYGSSNDLRRALAVLKRFIAVNPSSPHIDQARSTIADLETRIARELPPEDLFSRSLTGEAMVVPPDVMTGESAPAGAMTDEAKPAVEETR